MNEISVVLEQEPGKASWNFEEIKKALTSEMEVYKSIVYDDDSIQDAKKDRAELNKLTKTIKAKTKEFKETCLKPYDAIQSQANELIELIEEPLKMIDEKVKEYEARRVELVKKEIGEFFDGEYKASDLPEEIRKKVIMKLWDTKWTNATTAKKTWKEAITNGISQTSSEIAQLKQFESKFEKEILKCYYENLSFQSAVRMMNDLNKQKERISEAEREKIRREEQAKVREEARRLAEEEKQRTQATVTATPDPVQEPEPEPIPQATTQPDPIPIQAAETHKIVIKGNEIQLAKIKGYIKYVGATYEEVE